MKRLFKIAFRTLAGIIGSLLGLALLCLALLRLPAVQNFLTHKAAIFVSSKTHTHIQLNRLYIAFPKSVVIEKLFAEDQKHDTLIYVNKLTVDIDMLGLFKKKIVINKVLLNGTTANISRSESDSSYNFDFIIKAFATGKKKTNNNKASAAAWQVQVSKVALQNVRGEFNDEVGGTLIKGAVGNLALDMKAMNIKDLRFDGRDLKLEDADLSIIQTKAGKNAPDTSVVVLPFISLNKLRLQRVNFVYESKPANVLVSVKVGDLFIQPDKIDLNRHSILVKNADIEKTTTLVRLRKNESHSVAGTSADTPVPWQVGAGKLLLKAVNFQLDFSNMPHQPEGVDYNHLQVKNINLNINGAFYSPDKITADIKNISLREKSGFILKRLAAQGIYDRSHAELKNLEIVTNRSQIRRYAKITYPSIRALTNDIGALGIDADLQDSRIAIDDILLFAPQLKSQPVFKGNNGLVASVSGRLKGKLKDITASNLLVRVADSTTIDLNGHIAGLPEAINASYKVRINNITTTHNDLQKLFGDRLPEAINIPGNMALSGTAEGSIKSAKAKLALQTSAGNVNIDAQIKTAQADTQYIASINAEALDLGYLLKKTGLLGPVTVSANITGHGFAVASLRDSVKVEIKSAVLNKYDYHNISINASADSNVYTGKVSANDSAIVMDMQGSLSLVKEHEFVDADLNLTGANLKAMNLLKDDIRTSGKLNIDMKGDINNLNGRASLDDAVVIKEGETYRIDSLLVASVNDKKHSALKINSGIVMLDYEGTVKFPKLVTALTQQLNHYFAFTATKDSATADTSEQNFALAVKIEPHPVFNEVLLPKLKEFNGARLNAKYSSANKSLNVDAAIPIFNYGGNSFENVEVKAGTKGDSLNYKISVQHAKSGPVDLAETMLKGSVRDNSLQFDLSVRNKDSTGNKLIVSGNLKKPGPKTYEVHLDNNKFVLNNKRWQLPADNDIRFGASGFYANKVELSNGTQLLSAQSEGQEGDELKISFKQFDLKSLSQIVEADTALVRGMLDGTIDVQHVHQTPAFVSDLKINDIYYQLHPVGSIQLKADNLSAGKYSAQLTLTGFGNDVSVKGYYSSAGNSNILDFKTDINRINLQSIEPFTFGQIRRSSGYLTGSISVTGSTAGPVLNGSVSFKNAAFNLAYINNYLALKNESISIDGKGIYFHAVNILDSLGQKAIVDGAVYTSNFKKMKFDLTIKTNNFRVLNTTIRVNPLYFGRVILNSNIVIKGDETLPVVRASLKVVKGSNIAVVIPTSKISTDRGEGVVVLTDTAIAYKIMRPKDTVAVAPAFKGVDIAANVQLTKDASFKLIVDKTSGDSLVVKGDGILSFTMDESGNQSLTGTYTIDAGSYKATFQKIIKRELTIQKGGTITWNGSPLDATVNITAVYTVTASPADLMAAELASSTAQERAGYQKPLQFNVLMTMKGQLLKPEISFALDMQDQDKDANGGVVYAKITSLNNDPGELNQQVFALLVLNRFIPANTGSVDYGSAATSFARNSLNQMLTDELNALSGRYIKGVSLNFGVTANDNYTVGGVQQNTEVSVGLKKQFFKDRLSVQVGTSVNVQNSNGSISGADANNLTGDIVIEYKINKDGSLRFEAFRENEYEGLIDGSLYKTGVGLVLDKDYNTPKELFTRKKKAKAEKESE